MIHVRRRLPGAGLAALLLVAALAGSSADEALAVPMKATAGISFAAPTQHWQYRADFRPHAAPVDNGDRLVMPELPAPPPVVEVPPPPAPLYADLPVDASVPIFIPIARATAAQGVPSANPGWSPTLTLTFDDCASASQMQAIVDALGAAHRQGMFFITGQCRDHYPWLVGTLKAAGHQVCNHTYSHPDLRKLSDAGIRAEIGRGVFAGCPYFRPPYGGWDGPRGRVARIAAEYGLQVLLWDVDSRDWAGAGAAAMAAVARARGGVILFHLHGFATADAVRMLG